MVGSYRWTFFASRGEICHVTPEVRLSVCHTGNVPSAVEGLGTALKLLKKMNGYG